VSITGGRQPRVAVIGATGTVGGQLVDLIGEREFPFAELKLFASEAGSSEPIESEGKRYPVARLDAPSELANFDIAFLAVPEERALELIDEHPGPILIDLSAAARPPGNAPIVAPGVISREQVRKLQANKVFAIPNPAAQAIATIISSIGATDGFAGATYLAGASTVGRERVSDLFNQSADLLNARLDIEDGGSQVAFNLFIPEYGSKLADAIAAQVAALSGNGGHLAVQVVQVPAFHGSAITLSLGGSVSEVRQWAGRLRTAPGVLMIEGEDPAGFADAVGQETMILRLRQSNGGAIIWAAFDSARMAAFAALWVAESLWFSFS
jgi:aspartate-semialdehyde dehydrogenase